MARASTAEDELDQSRARVHAGTRQFIIGNFARQDDYARAVERADPGTKQSFSGTPRFPACKRRSAAAVAELERIAAAGRLNLPSDGAKIFALSEAQLALHIAIRWCAACDCQLRRFIVSGGDGAIRRN